MTDRPHTDLTVGYVPIEEGMYVFARDMWGDGDPLKDDLQAWVTPAYVLFRLLYACYRPNVLCRELLTEDLVRLIDDARDKSLGERKRRSRNKAFVNHAGEWEDGVRWEQSDLAINVEGAARCYTLGQSYQIPRNLVGPCAGSKIAKDKELSEHHKLRQTILNVSLLYDAPCMFMCI